MYGTAASTLTKPDLKSFSNVYDNVFRKIFRSYDRNVIAYCQWYCGFWPFQVLYEYNRFSFLNNLLQGNKLDRKLYLDNHDYLEFFNPMNKYAIDAKDSYSKIRFKIWKYCENSLP